MRATAPPPGQDSFTVTFHVHRRDLERPDGVARSAAWAAEEVERRAEAWLLLTGESEVEPS